MPDTELSHAVFAWALDGKGGGHPLQPQSADPPPGGLRWLHMDYQDPRTLAWLRNGSGIDPVVVEALTAPAPRPRSLVVGDGLMVILRGINVNDNADPEDMVALRFWLEEHRVITLRHRRIAAAQDVADQLKLGNGPHDAGDLLHDVTERLLDRIGPKVEEIEESVDALEEQVLSAQSRTLRVKLAQVRRLSISLRRYLVPQRETVVRLQSERVTWLSDLNRAHLREDADRVTRYVETLDSARERAAVTSEELSSLLAEQMNQTMYVLSVVAAIFLPLGLLTGLFGINVGGMPGTENPWSFAFVTVGLVILGVIEWLWFKRRALL